MSTTFKKGVCIIGGFATIGGAVELGAQALTAAELARIRNEKAAIERQIDQLTPQIARLEREQAEFSRNPENIRTAEQALAIAIQNEIDNSLPIWQNTHRSDHRTFFCNQTLINEINRRRDIACSTHRQSVRGVLDNSLPNKIINVTNGNMIFEDPAPAFNLAMRDVWNRYPNLSDQARRERADIAGVMATRDAGRLINITDKRVTSVQCRPTQTELNRLRNQEAQLRQRLSTLRSQYASGGGR